MSFPQMLLSGLGSAKDLPSAPTISGKADPESLSRHDSGAGGLPGLLLPAPGSQSLLCSEPFSKDPSRRVPSPFQP